MTCTNYSLYFGTHLHHGIYILALLCTAFVTWHLALYYHQWSSARELQKRIDYTNAMPYMPVDTRTPRYRLEDPKATIMKLKLPEERPAPDPTAFPGWKHLTDADYAEKTAGYWKVAAE